MKPEQKVIWKELADDDFIAEIGDYTLRVEQMDDNNWWWRCTYGQDKKCKCCGNITKDAYSIDSCDEGDEGKTEAEAKERAIKAMETLTKMI